MLRGRGPRLIVLGAEMTHAAGGEAGIVLSESIPQLQYGHHRPPQRRLIDTARST